MNKKNNFIKLTSVLLSLCLILAMLTSVAPASTLAFSEQGTIPDDSSGFDFVLEEDTTLRDAFSKHYIDPNGKRYAVIFPEQVHYKEGETWVEIDNSLQYDASKDVFVSQNNMFVSAFAKTANDNCLATISDGDYQLSWSIDFDSVIIAPDNQLESAAKANSNVQDVNAQITSAVQNDSSTVKSRENISDIGKAISGVTYKGICDFVDLRYTVLHGKLEEDNYYGTLRFTFYDHFGLDTLDMTQPHQLNLVCGYFPGFKQWYIIQHWDSLGAQVQPQPFVTLVSYTVAISGSLS